MILYIFTSTCEVHLVHTCTCKCTNSVQSVQMCFLPSLIFLFVCVGAAFKGMILRDVREAIHLTFMLRLTLTTLEL